MSNIINVKKAVVKFLKWNSVAEVYEDDSFLKSMNLPPKQVRLFYSVKIDENLEVTSFERLHSFEGMDGSD